MKTKEQRKCNIVYIGLLVLILISAIFSFYMNEKNNLYENILSLGNTDNTEQIKGNDYYKDYTLNYERGYYLEGIRSCEKARDSWSKYTQILREEKEKIVDFKQEIFSIYSELLESEIRLYNNMYEACEWFEVASRHYDYYFLENTPYDDASFDKGTGAIEEGNKKIEAHDLEVEIYNTLLAKYKKELKEIIN